MSHPWSRPLRTATEQVRKAEPERRIGTFFPDDPTFYEETDFHHARRH